MAFIGDVPSILMTVDYCAQLTADGLCYAISQTVTSVRSAYIVGIPSFDLSYLGRYYINGAWQ